MALEQTAVLELAGVTKRYDDVVANQSVSFTARAGEVHALVGENGAGKSTLMKIAAGLIRPDAGQIVVDGRSVDLTGPRDAAKAGIGMVHQHFSLVPSLSVAENVMLATLPTRFGMLDRATMRRRVSEEADRYGLELTPDGAIGDYPVGVQQRAEILKALIAARRLLILDEPTAVLTPQEADQLFATLANLRGQGHSIVLITHKLREVFAVADRVTVMRDGRAFEPIPVAETTQRELARMMVGREVFLEREDRPTNQQAGELLRLERVEALSDRGLPALRGVSLALQRGEILGIAGVVGNGQQELVEVIAGLRRVKAGRIFVGGQDVTFQQQPDIRRRLGIGHIPDDRLARGVATTATLADNLIMGRQDRPPIARGLRIDPAAIRETAGQLIRRFDIRAAGPDTPVGSLSGGNIQKVVVARELSAEPKVLLSANPTRGIDIGASEFIYEQLRQARHAGLGVLLVSSELDEIRALSDRIMVMYGGQLSEPFDARIGEHELGVLMAGGELDQSAAEMLLASAAPGQAL